MSSSQRCEEIYYIPPIIAVKAVTAAQLSMASDGIYRVTLDEAIEVAEELHTDLIEDS